MRSWAMERTLLGPTGFTLPHIDRHKNSVKERRSFNFGHRQDVAHLHFFLCQWRHQHVQVLPTDDRDTQVVSGRAENVWTWSKEDSLPIRFYSVPLFSQEFKTVGESLTLEFSPVLLCPRCPLTDSTGTASHALTGCPVFKMTDRQSEQKAKITQ